jgi:hypothetical protein
MAWLSEPARIKTEINTKKPKQSEHREQIRAGITQRRMAGKMDVSKYPWGAKLLRTLTKSTDSFFPSFATRVPRALCLGYIHRAK